MDVQNPVFVAGYHRGAENRKKAREYYNIGTAALELPQDGRVKFFRGLAGLPFHHGGFDAVPLCPVQGKHAWLGRNDPDDPAVPDSPGRLGIQ